MNIQQKGLITLFSAEFFERFSYWGLQSVLVLYLNKILNVSSKEIFEIFGAFTALSFMFSIVGGFLADRYFGFRFSVITGVLISILGNLLLIFSDVNCTYVGLSLVLVGNGLFTPNCANLLGTLYSENDKNRNKDFTLLYMATNLGGLLGPIIYGTLTKSFGWHFSFVISAISLSMWLMFFLKFKNPLQYKGLPPSKIINNNKLFRRVTLFIVITAVIVFFLLKDVSLTGKVLLFFGTCTVLFLAWCIKNAVLKDKFLLMAVFVMILFSLLFFSIEFQVNSSLLVFIQTHVDKTYLGWEIPTPFFAAVEPFFVIVLSPILAYFWKILDKREISPMYKIIFGLFLGGIAFYTFSYSAHLAYITGQKISMTLVIIGNIFLGAGEICLMPTVISAITKYSPQNLKSTLMGMLYLSLAFSGYISGIIATLTSSGVNTSKTLSLNYFHIYENIGFLTIVICTISILATLLVKHFFMKKYNGI